MSSLSGMFLYKNVTSAVTKSALDGKDGSFSIRFRKCFVSLIWDGGLLARSWMKWVM